MIGFLNIYKPSGLTSSNVVVKIRKQFKIKKVGHFGTLDPMAEGVLPIAIGKATRMFDYYLEKYKTYKATFQFGYITDTLDIEGNVLDRIENVPTVDEVKQAIIGFLGKQSQIPPDFSAKLINGVRAYKLARNGESIELKPKDVEITKFDLINVLADNTYQFEITCSSGTYIRSIARDLGYAVGSLCTMTALERTESGVFNIANAIKLDELLSLDNIEDKLISLTRVFEKIPVIKVSDNDFEKIRNGIEIDNTYSIDNYVFAENNGKIFAVLEAKDNKIKIKTYLGE